MIFLGGGRILSNLLQAPINAFNIPSTAICITIDLSTPGNSIDSLLYWLNVAKEFSKSALDNLQKSQPAVFEQMRARVSERWDKHEDSAKLNLSLVPIIVIGTKFDLFANQFESIKKK